MDDRTALINQIASIAEKLGILDMIKYRNICIQEEYITMKNDGVNCNDIQFLLSEKYCLSQDSIHKIIYKRRLG